MFSGYWYSYQGYKRDWYGHMEVWLDLKKLCLYPLKKKEWFNDHWREFRFSLMPLHPEP